MCASACGACNDKGQSVERDETGVTRAPSIMARGPRYGRILGAFHVCRSNATSCRYQAVRDLRVRVSVSVAFLPTNNTAAGAGRGPQGNRFQGAQRQWLIGRPFCVTESPTYFRILADRGLREGQTTHDSAQSSQLAQLPHLSNDSGHKSGSMLSPCTYAHQVDSKGADYLPRTSSLRVCYSESFNSFGYLSLNIAPFCEPKRHHLMAVLLVIAISTVVNGGLL